MEKIKLVKDAIKHLKYFIELEKTSKKVCNEKAQDELCKLKKIMLNAVKNDIEDIEKGE